MALVQQPNGIITREGEATHRLGRGSIVTSQDRIAVETDAILVLVHRSSTLVQREGAPNPRGDRATPYLDRLVAFLARVVFLWTLLAEARRLAPIATFIAGT